MLKGCGIRKAENHWVKGSGTWKDALPRFPPVLAATVLLTVLGLLEVQGGANIDCGRQWGGHWKERWDHSSVTGWVMGVSHRHTQKLLWRRVGLCSVKMVKMWSHF